MTTLKVRAGHMKLTNWGGDGPSKLEVLPDQILTFEPIECPGGDCRHLKALVGDRVTCMKEIAQEDAP